jgi:hypothetical protein
MRGEELHPYDPNDPGYTWPLTMDSVTPEDPIERIDLVFTNGPQPISIDRIGVDPIRVHKNDYLFASDHAGVAAEFNLLRCHTTGSGFGKKPKDNFFSNFIHNFWQKYSHRRF